MDLHPSSVDLIANHLQVVWNDAVVAARVLAATARVWPAAISMPTNTNRPTTREARAALAERRHAAARVRQRERMEQQWAAERSHAWVMVGSFRRCACCLARDSGALLACPGFPAAMLEWAARARGQRHALSVGVLHEGASTLDTEVLPCLFCRRCGAWTSAALQQRRGLLLEACRSLPARAGTEVLRRLERGLHPKPGFRPPLFSLCRSLPPQLLGPAERGGVG